LLALPGANQGRQTTNWFVVAPEVAVQIGYQITEHFRVQVGYEFLYVNDVVRPGDQIGLTVNPKLVPTSPAFGSNPGLNQPAPAFRQEEFWAHGLNVGIAFSY
jgi:hypothetical protein